MHDHRWCFTPDGLKVLLADFSETEIRAEGGSIAGMCRTINVFLDTFVRSDLTRRILRKALYPLINTIGLLLDRLSGERIEFTVNYSCLARK